MYLDRRKSFPIVHHSLFFVPLGIAATSHGEYQILLVNQPASMISEHSNGKAYHAVDNNNETDFFTHWCAHTQGNEDYPWWSVDMGGVKTVSRVSILNRGDCCGEIWFSIHLSIDYLPKENTLHLFIYLD